MLHPGGQKPQAQITWLRMPNLFPLRGNCNGVLTTIQINTGNWGLADYLRAPSRTQWPSCWNLCSVARISGFHIFQLLMTGCTEWTGTLKWEKLWPSCWSQKTAEKCFSTWLIITPWLSRHGTWTDKTVHWLMAHFYWPNHSLVMYI